MNVSFITIITFLVASCAQTLGGTVLELAEKLGAKTLAKLVTEGELTDTLSGPGPFTLFAPNDAAFAALPKDTYERLTKDKFMLKSVLQFHVLGSNLFSREMLNDLMATTLNMNMKVRVNVYNKIITVDGSKVVLTDQNVTNGVIHVIDKVLYQLPKQNILQFGASNTDFSQLTYAVTKAKLEMSFGGGPFTLFVPTNEAFNKLPPDTLNKLLHDEIALKEVLTYHLVKGTVYSIGLSNGMVPTVEGRSVNVMLNSDGVTINNAQVTMADIPVSNGVVHVIDTVLLPPV